MLHSDFRNYSDYFALLVADFFYTDVLRLHLANPCRVAWWRQRHVVVMPQLSNRVESVVKGQIKPTKYRAP